MIILEAIINLSYPSPYHPTIHIIFHYLEESPLKFRLPFDSLFVIVVDPQLFLYRVHWNATLIQLL